MKEKENIFDYHNSVQKNVIDLKFLKAINKWIIIKFNDYRWVSKETPNGGTHLIG